MSSREITYNTPASTLALGWVLRNLDGSTTKIIRLNKSNDGGVSFATDDDQVWSVPGGALVTVVSDN